MRKASVNVYLAGDWSSSKPLLIFHHGAGQTALTFSLLAVSLSQDHFDTYEQKQLRHTFRIAAFDCRGHGEHYHSRTQRGSCACAISCPALDF